MGYSKILLLLGLALAVVLFIASEVSAEELAGNVKSEMDGQMDHKHGKGYKGEKGYGKGKEYGHGGGKGKDHGKGKEKGKGKDYGHGKEEGKGKDYGHGKGKLY